MTTINPKSRSVKLSSARASSIADRERYIVGVLQGRGQSSPSNHPQTRSQLTIAGAGTDIGLCAVNLSTGNVSYLHCVKLTEKRLS